MCPSIRINFLIFLCLALHCTAESDEVLEFQPDDDPLADDYVKNINSNGCTSREQYFACPGAPTCQKTCSNLNGACVTDGNCVPGCYCRSGYARDVFTNECIPIKQCPGTSCPRNEFFNTCESRTECERTCAERNIPCDPAIPCNTLCQCKSGFFRDPVSKSCVRERDCNTPSSNPPRCPRNEHFESCGSGCKETCPGNQNCALECISGCFCDAGLVRIKGRCVEASKCTKNCPTGERPGCIVPCSESCDPKACDGITDTTCREQCVCPPGAKRNPEGKCVHKDDCPLFCGDFEEEGTIVPCSESCNPTECTKDPPPSLNEVRMCVCKSRYKRNADGKCVEESDCPLICPENEEEGFREPCQDSCFEDECTVNPPQSTSPARQCVCKAGHSRTDNQKCIKTEDCPKCREGEEFTTSVKCAEHCDESACLFNDLTPVERCSCKNGQKRQYMPNYGYGKCVDQTDCHCLDENARYDKLTYCHNDCTISVADCEIASPTVGAYYSCFCIDNYRQVNGVCQPIENC